eukprot:8562862-Pyramimonas_sp.AAC.1
MSRARPASSGDRGMRRPWAGPCMPQPLGESLGWHGVRSLQGDDCRLPPIARERVRAPSRYYLLVKQPPAANNKGT